MKRILSIIIAGILAGAFAFAGLAPASASASSRTRALHITKECSQFQGQAGQFCTITSSNLRAIPVGSRVFYLAPVFTASGLDTDIVLYAGPGNSALGHVTLAVPNGPGTVTFNGGTGNFRHFHASAVVTYNDPLPGGVDWAWDGTYHFSDH
jgi:hypothetical protein